MKAPAHFRYTGPLSGLLPAARAEATRREGPKDAARWDLAGALLALLLALHCADTATAPAPRPAAPVAGIAHL